MSAQSDAAALSAFRAACVALVGMDQFDLDVCDPCDDYPRCQLCDGAVMHEATCPVALARAAIEKYPEVTA